ncbi:MAG: cryptochrome/photolyase family protein [Xanthomonadales bacterium]|nr:cryptochrome/photolyase family protein [Xanthomonadales bacterium]
MLADCDAPLARPRRLVVVLGDQLDPEGPGLSGFDRAQDAIWMAEVEEEATRVWSHKARIALFLAAMRRFAAGQRARGRRVVYRALGEHPHRSLDAALAADLDLLRPERVVLVEPGEWGLREALHATLRASGLPWEERQDRHFLCRREEFAAFARGRRALRMEAFYRWLRRRTGVLMNGSAPLGGRFNFDAENRAAFGRAGPGRVPAPLRFLPDRETRAVLAFVARRFAEHPGALEGFDWPLDPERGAGRAGRLPRRAACPASGATRMRCGAGSRCSSIPGFRPP